MQDTGPGLNVGGNPGLQSTDITGKSIAICFDTYSNAPYNDPPYDSLQVHVNGQLADAAPVACGNFGTGPTLAGTTCGRPSILQGSLNAKDGLNHSFTFHWTASTGTLTVTEDATGSVRGTYVFGANAAAIFSSTTAYYGFTAGTGSVSNFQSFAQISAVGQSVVGCQATPTVVASLTPVVLAANTCGTPTTGPSFTNTPTQTPYQSPTITTTPYPAGCGPPVFQEAKLLGSGCMGSTGSISLPYSFTTAANQLLIVRMTTSNSTTTPSGVTFGGTPWFISRPVPSATVTPIGCTLIT